jgi:hypothetical protein
MPEKHNKQKNVAPKSSKKHREKPQKLRNIPQDSRDRYFRRVTEKFQSINTYSYNFASHVCSKKSVELITSHNFEEEIVALCNKNCILIHISEPDAKQPVRTQIWSIKNMFAPLFIKELTGRWETSDSATECPIILYYPEKRLMNLQTRASQHLQNMPYLSNWIYFDSNHLFYTFRGMALLDITTDVDINHQSSEGEYLYGHFPTTARGGCIALFMYGYIYLVQFDKFGKMKPEYEILKKIGASFGCCIDGDKVLWVDKQKVKIYNLENEEFVKKIKYDAHLNNFKRFYQIGNNAILATEKYMTEGCRYLFGDDKKDVHHVYSLNSQQWVEIDIPGEILHIDGDVIIVRENDLKTLSFYRLVHLKKTAKLFNAYQHVHTYTFTDLTIKHG